MDFDIQSVGRTNMTRRIDQIKKRIAAIEEKIGVTKIGADFQTTLEREIQRQAQITAPQPTQGVADVQKPPGTTQPVNDNDIVNSAKVAEALRQAESVETPQPATVEEKPAGVQPPETISPDKQTKPQQSNPPQIERVEFPDVELTIPERDEKISRDDYFGDSAELVPVEDLIMQTAVEQGVDPQLVRAIATAESNMNQDEISPVGAIGVMQLMPETAQALGVNPYDVNENVLGGTIYLKQMLDTFDGNVPLAVAAYNAGPNAVKRYGGIPPYAETQNYVGRVMDMFQ
ncbi:MAG: lytic transglycosylase domain-containing protein [Selenomonadaceae bacterium]|nr:lytic transglycosylase domain-containing protein [Selenomonadaceae bacterium]MBR4382626.1 lytic transglycosylase domain-containing protein [Selenomonadaceae bacterium]